MTVSGVRAPTKTSAISPTRGRVESAYTQGPSAMRSGASFWKSTRPPVEVVLVWSSMVRVSESPTLRTLTSW